MLPSTHMSGQPKGGGHKGPPGTSMKANATNPTSPSILTDGGNHPGIPKGSANQGPPGTSVKADARHP